MGTSITGEDSNNFSGKSISLNNNGTTLAIGEVGNNFSFGQVRVFEKQAGNWVQKGNSLKGLSKFSQFGNSVSLNNAGDILAVGAFGNDDIATDSGIVKLYQFSSGVWTQLGSSINGVNAYDKLGYSVALNNTGDIVAIGAIGTDVNGNQSGQVQVYKLNANVWTKIGDDINGEGQFDESGKSISINGDGSVIIIGAPSNSNSNNFSGHIRVYENQSGNWTQIGDDIDGSASSDQFGSSVSINDDGSIIAVGASGNDDNGSGAGEVKIFKNNSGNWIQVGNDINGNVSGDAFGYSVSLNNQGSRVVIGSWGYSANRGKVEVFQNNSDIWELIDTGIEGVDVQNNFGSSVSLSGDGKTFAAGAPGNDGNGNDSGHVRVFENTTSIDPSIFFITKWKTTIANESITIPTNGNGYDYSVDWGDGNITTNHTSSATHTYAISGEYEVKISGDFPRISFRYGSSSQNRNKIINIIQWGSNLWSGLDFYDCRMLELSATDKPNLTNTTSISYMFYRCSLINSNINHWNVSTIDNMENFLFGASAFNQPLNDWDMSSVTRMTSMLRATAFNHPLDKWDVSNVIYMGGLFAGTSFNYPINNWDVSNVEFMYSMFSSTTFNQPLDNWNTSNVKNMSNMFTNNTAFNQNLNSWNVTKVEDMRQMFQGATSFNGTIGNWVTTSLTTTKQMFYNSSNFNQPISGWDLSKVTDMNQMFYGATSFNQPIENWDVSKVTDMGLLFFRASSFNQPLNNWDVGSITSISSMFRDATKFNQPLDNWNIQNVWSAYNVFDNSSMSTRNYDKTLIGWSNLSSLKNDVVLGADQLKYCASASARNKIINDFNWRIFDAGEDCSGEYFITKWKTTTANEQLTIPVSTYQVSLGNYNYTVDWGDGTIDTNITNGISHTYTSSGEYMIKISGDFPMLLMNNSSDKEKLLEVTQWGSIVWSFMSFNGASNLQIIATDAPDLSNVTSFTSMFKNCTTLNANINHWDVSTITNMNNLFEGATSFNQPLNDWDVSSLTGTAVNSMFKNATSFNQPLNNWDVSNVTSLISMFEGASSFNQPLNNWDVSNVAYISRMFLNASSFNEALNDWNTSKLVAMYNTFDSAIAFNQPLNNWNVSSVISFSNCFNNATSFNQSLNDWDVSNATDFNNMFRGASKFNQPLHNWNVEKVTTMVDMFNNTSLSVINYDKTLIGWAALPNLQTDVRVNLDANLTNFCNSETARNTLITTFLWRIDDAGKDCSTIDTPANVNGIWNDPTNWASGEVPSSSDNVVIPTGTTLQISDDISEINSLENEGTIVIRPTYSLKSKSNMVNNGTIVMDSDNDDSSVLFVVGTSTGNIKYTRGGLKANKWSLVTPPVSGQKIKEFATNVANDIRTNETVSPIRYAIGAYDDSAAADNKWSYFTTSIDENLTFTAGQSYAISRATDGSVSFTGTLTTSNTIKTLKPGEWNAIGNPFTTYYPANKNGANSFINDNYDILDDNFKGIYIWDNNQNKYVAASEVDIANRSLTPGQGFFIKVKEGADKVQFIEDKRSLKPATGNSTFNKSKQSYVKLFASNGSNTVTTDIKFFANATAGFDVGFDIGNFGTSSFDIYTKLLDGSNSKNYTIQSLGNNFVDNVVIPFGVTASNVEVVFSSKFENLNEGTNVFIEDKLNNILYDITNPMDSYSVFINESENTQNRFYIHISSKSLSVNDELIHKIQIYANNDVLHINNVVDEGELKIYNLLGQDIYSKSLSKQISKLPLNLPQGVYIIKLNSKIGAVSKKVTIK